MKKTVIMIEKISCHRGGFILAYRVLIAEDDDDIIDVLTLYLENAGYIVLRAVDGDEAWKKIESMDVDLIILDIMMPKISGYELVKKIRERSTMPILILSAKSLDSDKILGLDIGADDYLTKPFNPLEVVARSNSLLRRFYKLGADSSLKEVNDKLVVGELVLDGSTYQLTRRGEHIVLTPTEYRILEMLMKSPGRVYTKAQIFEAVRGEYIESDENVIMVHISKLREKIEVDSKQPNYIKTIRGIGYKIEKNEINQ